MFGHTMGFGMGLGGFWMGVLTVALVLLALWIARALLPDFGRSEQAGPPDAAVDTLRERFARGEIDREEFEQRREALHDHSPS